MSASEFEDSYEEEIDRGARSADLGLEEALARRTLADVVEDVDVRLLEVAPDAPVQEAVKVMNENRTGCVLVLADGELAGIFTERDVLTRIVGAGLDAAATPVRDVMTPDPEVLPATAAIAYALNTMSVAGFRHVPVVGADGRPLGVVSQRTLVNWVVELLPEDVLNLPPGPQVPRAAEGG